MGTRGTIHIVDGTTKKTIVSLYTQSDSYETELGSRIKEILDNGNSLIINGFSGKHDCPAFFNGASCLGAYLIGQLKMNRYNDDPDDEFFSVIGRVYITNSSDRQEYNYFIVASPDMPIKIKVTDYDGKALYKGTLKEYNPKRGSE